MLPIGGGYKLLKRIGSGTFGEVWSAEAPGGVPVAVKVLIRPVDHAEAQRELQALELIKRLQHPFLLGTHNYTTLEDRLFIVMELADGSLRDRVRQCRQAGQPGIPLPELFRYFRESSEALDFLHSEKVLHRDIKPENILILKGHAKVADFGLARGGKSWGGQAMMSATGCGTPAYMAPEVWRGKVSEHTDQYSLALAYAELRVNRRLFPENDFMQLMLSHLEKTPDLAPLAQAEQKVILRALAKDPAQRFPNCLEFADALQDALGRELGLSRTGLIAVGESDRSSTDTSQQETADNLATVGGSSPPRPRTSGGPTEKIGWRPPASQRSVWQSLLPAIILLLGIGGAAWYYWPRSPHETIVPPPVLPPGAEAANEATISTDNAGKQHYSKIYIVKGNVRIPFVLVPGSVGAGEPRTFYIMENKVSVGLFRQFAGENPAEVKNREWEKIAEENVSEHCPALGISVEDADRFAHWVGGASGKLPTLAQWDTAAGRFVTPPRIGPFEGTWEKNVNPPSIAVGDLKAPLEIGAASADKSPFGCQDMSGNGREWTRNLTGSGSRMVPIPKPGPGDRVVLRGRGFEEGRPLNFDDLAKLEEQGRDYDNQEYTETDRNIGFRVVIEP
jgi:serine/threonine protein kinase